MRRLREFIRRVQNDALRMRTINAVMIVLAGILALSSLQTTADVAEQQRKLQEETAAYTACVQAADELSSAMSYLSNQAQLFVLTQGGSYLKNYAIEVGSTQRKEQSIETLTEFAGSDVSSVLLSEALENLDQVAETERHALTLVADATDCWPTADLRETFEVPLAADERDMTPGAKISLAKHLIFNAQYKVQHEHATRYLQYSLDSMVRRSRDSQEETIERLSGLLTKEHLLIISLLLVVVATILMVVFLILWPLGGFIARIRQGSSLARRGTYELRFLAESYNRMYDETRARQRQLQYAAEHDSLTGLYNRAVYEELSTDLSERSAILIFDVDLFKEVNDSYGHTAGDKVLRKVADALQTTFRKSDYCCRIGGDEFLVVMMDVDPSLRHVVELRVENVRRLVAEPTEGLPAITLSIGVAFGGDGKTSAAVDTFKAADRALYHVKEAGRNGFAFAGDVG